MTNYYTYLIFMQKIPILDMDDFTSVDLNYSLHFHETEGAWEFESHTHKNYCELIYIGRGELNNTVNDQKNKLQAGDLMLVREKDYHQLRGKNLIYYNLNIRTKGWIKVLEFMGCSKKVDNLTVIEPLLIKVSLEKRKWLLEELDRLFHYQKQVSANLLMLSFLTRLIAEIVFPPEQINQNEECPEWLSNLLISIEESQGIMTVSELPKIAHKSHEHIARSCKKYFNSSPSTLISNQRLKRAALLLSHTDKSIVDIVYEVGYSNLSYFYSTFKRKYQLSPAAYRKAHFTGKS